MDGLRRRGGLVCWLGWWIGCWSFVNSGLRFEEDFEGLLEVWRLGIIIRDFKEHLVGSEVFRVIEGRKRLWRGLLESLVDLCYY